MSKELSGTKRNHPAYANVPLTEELPVTGFAAYVNNLKTLASANEDWALTPEQIVASGKANRKIFRIRFLSNPVRFSPGEAGSGTIHVLVKDTIVGILDPETTARLKKRIASSEIHNVSCVIQGGSYKIVDESGHVKLQQCGISAVVTITYRSKAPAGSFTRDPVPPKAAAKSPGPTAVAKVKKKSSEKKPFYRRFWVWILAAILALGSCGRETNTAIPMETTLPAASLSQTETTWESTQTICSEPVFTDRPTVEPSTATIPPETAATEFPTSSTAETTCPATADSHMDSATEPSAQPFAAPAAEEKEIIVYLSKTGSKYHSKPNCGRMKDGTPVSLETALQRNMEACKNCH